MSSPAVSRVERRKGIYVETSPPRTFSGLPRILIKRWYLTIVGLLATATLCVIATVLVPVTYTAKAEILLVPPTSPTANGNNPYLALSGLTLATDVVQRAMSGTSAAGTLAAQGVVGKYSAIRDLTTSGPVLLVTTEGKSPAETLNSLGKVVALVPPTVRSVQQAISVPPNAQFGTYLITQDNKTSIVRKSQIRAIVVAFALGLFLTLIAVACLDGWLNRRARRKQIHLEAAATGADAASIINAESRSDRPTAGHIPTTTPAAKDERQPGDGVRPPTAGPATEREPALSRRTAISVGPRARPGHG